MVKMDTRRVIIALFLSAAFLLSGSAAQAENSNPFWESSSGRWLVGAFLDDEGLFSHCDIRDSYPNGIDLSIGLTRDCEIAIVLSNRKWELAKSGSYDTDVQIDQTRIGAFKSRSLDGNSLLINLGSKRSVFDRLRRGKSLKIAAAKTNLYFDLTGTNKALLKLKECADISKSLFSSDKNRFASPGQKSKALKAKSDAQVTITKLLELSGFGKVDLIDPFESAYNFADIAWKAETFQGFAQINSVDEGGTEKAVRMFIGNLASGCEGVFCSQIEVTAPMLMYPPPPPERFGSFPDDGKIKLDAKASIQKIIDAIVALNCPTCSGGFVLVVAKTELKKWEDSCRG